MHNTRLTYKTLTFIVISMIFSLNANAILSPTTIDFSFDLNASDWNQFVGGTDGDTLTFSFLDTTDLYNIDSSDIYSYKFDLQAGTTVTNYYDGLAWSNHIYSETGNIGEAFNWNGSVLDFKLGYTNGVENSIHGSNPISRILTGAYGQLHQLYDTGTGPTSGNLTIARWDGAGVTLSSTTTAVPEPSTLAIFALGLMGLASRRLKKQAQ